MARVGLKSYHTRVTRPSQPTTAAGMRSHAPSSKKAEFAGSATMGPKGMPEAKKPVRYEVIISNWKRYRSKTNERTEYTARW
jgi:hypothetical protein